MVSSSCPPPAVARCPQQPPLGVAGSDAAMHLLGTMRPLACGFLCISHGALSLGNGCVLWLGE